jgi:hypothetical protein
VAKVSPFAKDDPIEKPKIGAVKIEKPKIKVDVLKGIKRLNGASSYVHVVTIPLRPDAPPEAADLVLADVYKHLTRIPSVRVLRAGRPAVKDSKDYVQRDYAIGLLILANDHDGLKEYLDHPLHREFVERNRRYIDFGRLRVFDFVDER